jgi:transposase
VSAAAASPEEVQLLREENAALRAQIAWLKQQLFGPGKSEKLDRAQMRFQLEELERLAAKAEQRVETITYERAKPAKEPRSVPAETFAKLPVVETIEIVPEPVKQEPELYERIGEERTFEVDVIEPKLVKREIVRPKFRHKLDRARPPLIAAAPARPVSGGYASAGLLAWIAISKYVHHLPLYRLEQMSQRWGAQISRRTMSDWIEVTAEWLAPIYRHMHRGLLAGDYLQADETPVRCNDPDEKRGGTTQGYLWVISRPAADVVFDWRLSRRHGELTSLLDGFKGVLQSDAYSAYPSYVRRSARSRKLCNWCCD